MPGQAVSLLLVLAVAASQSFRDSLETVAIDGSGLCCQTAPDKLQTDSRVKDRNFNFFMQDVKPKLVEALEKVVCPDSVFVGI